MSQQLTEPTLLRPPGQSRFVLLERPYSHPGNCKICGAVDRPVVDFGATDDDGAIYFCVECLTEVAKGVLNLVDASELRQAQLTAGALRSQLNKVGGNVDDYIANLRNLHDSFISDVNGVPGLYDKEPKNIPVESGGQGYAEVRDSGSGESPVSEPVSSEGPISVPAISSDEPNESSVFNV